MSWIVFKSSIKSFWLWVKHHWQIPFFVVWTILVYILTRRNSDAVIEVLEAKRDSYKKQIKILKDSHNREILKRESLSQKYEETLRKVEEKFKTEQKDLTRKQKNDIKEVVIKSKGDADEIKKRIQEEFGFEFIE